MRKIVLVFLFIGVYISLKAQLVFEENFNNYNLGKLTASEAQTNWTQMQTCETDPNVKCKPCVTSAPQEIVNNITFNGSNVGKFTISGNEQWYEVGSGSCKFRNENRKKGIFVNGDEVWFGFAVYLQSYNSLPWLEQSTSVDGQTWSTPQWHFAQFLRDGDKATVFLDLEKLSSSDPFKWRFKCGSTSLIVADPIWDGWNTIVCRIKLSSSGLMEAWINGKHLLNSSVNVPSATSYWDYKNGIYGDRPFLNIAYFDNIKVAKGANQFNTVNPATVTSTNDYSILKSEISIFPNPTSDELTLIAEKDSKIQITNITGQIVKSFTLNTEMQNIDLSELQNGIYIIQIIKNNKVSFQKIIKK